MFTDLTGKRFGRLVVIERSGTETNGAVKWLCRCDCGCTTVVRSYRLRKGITKSCGCYMREVSARMHGEPHGCSNDRLYGVWRSMKARCNRQTHHKYKDYGGRGITVCNEWSRSFTKFREWALDNGYDYNAPYGQCTLDRINVDGNYEPSNCRWVDSKTQANNQRPRRQKVRGIEVDYRGVHYISLAQLAREYGFHPSRLERRIHRMPIDDAMAEILGSTGR